MNTLKIYVVDLRQETESFESIMTTLEQSTDLKICSLFRKEGLPNWPILGYDPAAPYGHHIYGNANHYVNDDRIQVISLIDLYQLVGTSKVKNTYDLF